MSVFTFDGQDIVTIREESLDKIRQAAKSAPLRRSRYCLHHDNEDQVHEMIIAFCRDSYVRPHKHLQKTESFHVIEGELVVVFFDDNGNQVDRLKMGTKQQGGPFIYRLACDMWHTVIALTDSVIIHETTCGPFIKEESIFPIWAPEDGDEEGIKKFISALGVL